MLPKRFAEAAENARSTYLADSARVVADGRTKTGKQLRVFKGIAPDETPRDSIGYFLVVTASDSKSHPRKQMQARPT